MERGKGIPKKREVDKRREVCEKRYKHGSDVGKLAKMTNQPDDSRFPNLDQEINKLFLFHGTSTRKTGRNIAEEGFDVGVANLAAMYGSGSYSADCSCKSNQYTGGGKIRTFLICRVLMGCPFFTQKTHNDPACPTRRPPENTNGQPYDSIFAQSGVADNGSQLLGPAPVRKRHISL